MGRAKLAFVSPFSSLEPLAVKAPQELSDLPYAADLVAHSGLWVPDASYDTVHVDQARAADADASGARFLESAFTATTFDGGRLRRARFLDVWVHETRFVATDLAETEWRDCTLIGAVLAGAQLFSAQLRRVVFQGCKLDAVNFRDATLTDVTFEDCLINDSDFSTATLTRVAFPHTTLRGTDVSDTKMTKVDLRTADLGLILGPTSLRGATIDPTQLQSLAPHLAKTQGITVTPTP